MYRTTGRLAIHISPRATHFNSFIATLKVCPRVIGSHLTGLPETWNIMNDIQLVQRGTISPLTADQTNLEV